MKIIKVLLLCLICNTFVYGQMKQPTPRSGKTVLIKMGALDQPFMYNRLGAAQPTGMIFALENDIVAKPHKKGAKLKGKVAGNVTLIDGKRPRPIVLRANVGDIIKIEFTNYLRPYDTITTRPTPYNPVEFYEGFPTDQLVVNPIYPATRDAGVHIIGTNLVNSISDDASWVGDNKNSLAKPGQKKTYTLFADAEGTFVLHSTADNIGDGTIRAGQISNGLFGSLIVEPPGAEWYRSQVTEDDLYEATKWWVDKDGVKTASKPPIGTSDEAIRAFKQKYKGWPVIDYNKKKNGIPILKMYTESGNVRTLVHSDLTALITGPNAGDFVTMKNGEYTSPSFLPVHSSPNREQPYREFSIHYHEAPYAVQAFPVFYNNDTSDSLGNITQTLQGGVDQFAFNYGTGGIGAEIYANRVGVGPMADCVDCAYEEFFLSAWAVGDPATVVDIPANASTNVDPKLSNQQKTQKVLQDLMLREAALIGGATEKTDPNKINRIRATQAFFPDDPSNVYHSYMNDHVKFRINHCGAGITHVHHQHAHQWLHSPNSTDGHYLDSQTINPGASYTLEIVYGGSGNMNKTVGDQIFHCHFYPHFAQGMWAMWRVHDVLESGTVLAEDGNVAEGSRAYPDHEIKRGTPIPGLVPIKTLAMAPIPSRVSIDTSGQVKMYGEKTSPGFPFYIPGIAGQRVPHPPLDFARAEGVVTESGKKLPGKQALNGGLPRSIIIEAEATFENHTIYDWTKTSAGLTAVQLPEEGTYYEKVAMATHAIRNHYNPYPTGATGGIFYLNGRPPVQGAPYADPAVDMQGKPAGTKRQYKAANIQVDAVLNELGWHYPQQRPIVLWGDVAATVAGTRPPEPFFFRANSDEYIEFWSTNLVPEYYELDDFQVRTPTDVIGQHIHLVKFDVTSSDGAENGWNYEDGTLAPSLVTNHIDEINKGKRYVPNYDVPFTGSVVGQRNAGNLITSAGLPKDSLLEAYRPNPLWGDPPKGQDSWLGAQTTVQRWYSNPLYGTYGNFVGSASADTTTDRTLRTVFTHDHFGPSTHQQIGLYAGLLIEPKNSKWLDSSTGSLLGFATNDSTRNVKANGKTYKVSDGGPTDWQAIIETPDVSQSYREFMFEFQDNQQAYLAGSIGKINYPYPEFEPPLGSSKKKIQAYTDAYTSKIDKNYRGWIDHVNAIGPPRNGPELVSTGNRGTLSLNYRNSPLPIRVAPGGGPNSSDMAYAYSSLLKRGETAFNTQPKGGSKIDGKANDFKFPVRPLSPGMEGKDPYTPLARAYSGDNVQIRTLVGAHVNPHFFNIHGVKWFFEPSSRNSGFRSTQMMSLSEHFEMNFKLPYPVGNSKGNTDYLYVTNADDTGLQAGTFGYMRSYNNAQTGKNALHELPNNKLSGGKVVVPNETGTGCPTGAPQKHFDVTAISIDKHQIGGPNWGTLVYNETRRNYDTRAIIFIHTDEKDLFMHSSDYIPRPLVLRANAGDCINVTLRNDITPDFVNNEVTWKYASESFEYETSHTVGMHAELVNYDVSNSDGTAIGQNALNQLVKPGGKPAKYKWYAGQWSFDGNNNKYTSESVELGTCVLTAPDPLLQYVSGLFGALIIEPEGSYTVPDRFDPTCANVYDKKGGNLLFREFVLMFEDNLSIAAEPIGPITGVPIVGAVNYKSDPLVERLFTHGFGHPNFNAINVSDVVSNNIVLAAPETPTFAAAKGTPVRFRVMYPGGTGDGSTFDLHGHVWQEEPYTDHSKKLGFNVESQWIGARGQLGALNSFDLLINKAGGNYSTPGQYLYRDYRNEGFKDGIWGIFAVTDGKDAPMITRITKIPLRNPKKVKIAGQNTVDPTTGLFAKSVTLSSRGGNIGTASVSQFTGKWEFKDNRVPSGSLTVTSTLADGSRGGTVTYNATQVAALVAPPRKRPLMTPVKRSPVKQIEPGSNKPFRPFENLRSFSQRRK